jgi:hypothetical protein
MRDAFAAIALVSLMICLIAEASYAQSSSSALSISGDFGRQWISSFKSQNQQPAEQNLGNDLWSWGGSPKGSIIANGNIVPDPYYVWKSLNYSSGWIGKVGLDPNTGNPVYGYVDPYTGMVINYYMDPKTGRPVYVNGHPDFGISYFGIYSPDYDQAVYALPSIFI